MPPAGWSLGATARRMSGAVDSRSARGLSPWTVSAPPIDPALLAARVTFDIEAESAEQAEITLYRTRGEDLARDEAWQDLVERVTLAEETKTTTLGGLRHRSLLMSGALMTIDAPLAEGNKNDARRALATFQMAQAAAPHCPVRAALASRANVGLAWSLRGERPMEDIASEERATITARVKRAVQILSVFKDNPSPLLAEARYRTGVFHQNLGGALPPLYTAWAEADPMDPAPMEMHGFYMLPRWGGTHREIELEARRAALRTDPDLGFAGYAMLALPLLEHEPEILLELDPSLFIEGLDDWLSCRPEPGRVNSFLREIVEILNSDVPGLEGRPEIESFKQALSEALPDLIDRHLRAVVQSAWDGDIGWARTVIAHAFGAHISGGGSVQVEAAGVTLSS